MDKNKVKEKVQKVAKCYTNLGSEQKKVLHYSIGSFCVGLIFGLLIKRRRRE